MNSLFFSQSSGFHLSMPMNQNPYVMKFTPPSLPRQYNALATITPPKIMPTVNHYNFANPGRVSFGRPNFYRL